MSSGVGAPEAASWGKVGSSKTLIPEHSGTFPPQLTHIFGESFFSEGDPEPQELSESELRLREARGKIIPHRPSSFLGVPPPPLLALGYLLAALLTPERPQVLRKRRAQPPRALAS